MDKKNEHQLTFTLAEKEKEEYEKNRAMIDNNFSFKSLTSLSTISSYGTSKSVPAIKLITNKVIEKEYDRKRKLCSVIQLIITLCAGITYPTIPSFVFLFLSLFTIMGMAAGYPRFWLELV